MGKYGKQTSFEEFRKSSFIKSGETFQCKGCNSIFQRNSNNQIYCASCSRTVGQRLGRAARKRKNPKAWKARIIYTSLHHYGIVIKTDKIIEWIENTPNCIYCSNSIPIKDYSVDHIIPRSRGGSDTIENIQLVCRSCNLMKGGLLDNEFRELLDWLKDKPTIYAILKQRLKAAGFMYT